MPAQLRAERNGSGGWKFFWGDLIVRLDRLQESARRGVSAELTAYVINDGVEPTTITQGFVTLSSLQSRATLARRLGQLHPSDHWNTLIENVAVHGIRLLREGEPVQHIAPGVEAEPLTFRLNPLVWDQRPTILFSDGGLGKSYLALLGGLCVAAGAKIAGLHGVRGSVGFLDYEAEHGDHVRRADCLRAAHSVLAQADLLYWRMAVPLPDFAAHLRRLVAEHDLKLLIVDSLALACGGDPQSPDSALRYFAALRHLRCATLTIAHVPKNAEEKSIYGSVFFKNLARSCWELKKVQEAGSHTVHLGLFNTKSNLDGGHAPLGFEVRFAQAMTTFAPLDVAEEPGFEGVSVIERLKRALAQHGPATAEELAGYTGVRPDVARVTLTRENGRAVEACEKKGKAFVWRLKESPKEST